MNTKYLAFLTVFFLGCTTAVYSLLTLSSCAHQGGGKVASQSSAASQPVTSFHALPGEQAMVTSPDDPGLMTKIRQITFEGPRAGEGYFSPDGKKMIMQSEREPGNPFYQIYILDLVKGGSERISTGKGKTTCAAFHPYAKKLIYASTHEDPQFSTKVEEELKLRKSQQKMKYAWSFDDQFDIYEKDLTTGKLKNLTHTLGYDAEGAYSPDGKKIVFASNRAAWTDKLTDEERKIFTQDPSFMMDIYVMDADGSNVKRLTTERGYDGGPFFSPDGKSIVWRHFQPNGQSAEIYTMNSDGSNQRALTHWGAMSWAPFYHPSGDYIIFTSSRLGFTNFELFIVDTAGAHEPARVSYIPDFDGLPVFSPDGKILSWTHRNEKGESQIYTAQWNDSKARELLGLKQPAAELHLADLDPAIRKEDIHAVISYLASDEFNGRKTGGAEEKIYTGKISEFFQKIGLVPLNSSGKGFQTPFEFTSKVELGTENKLFVEGEKLDIKPTVGTDFVPLSFSRTGRFEKAPVVFAGYGINAPAVDKNPAFDSFKNVDVKGKWALILRDIPEGIDNTKRIHLNMFSRLQHKVLIAKERGAVGVLIAAGPNSGSKQKLMKLKYDGASGTDASIPVINITDELADKFLASTGRTLKQWQDVLDTGEVQGTDIPKLQVQALVDLSMINSEGINILGKIAVKGARETLVIGAHGDHLGRGEIGNSLARKEEQNLIHYGADDNASGVAGVLELAHYFSTMHRLGKIKLKQNLVFAVWSGEEIGLLGSAAWVKNQKSEKISAYLNMDMIGRYRDRLMVQGVGSAPEWKGIFESLVPQTDLNLVLTEDPYLPSDSMAFYLQKIPGIMFFTGAHGEYHSPRDRVELINLEGEVQVVELMKTLIEKLARENKSSTPLKLTYQKAEGSSGRMQGRSFRVYMGTIPDYAQQGVKGVKISGTSKDSPAEKAGLQTGDVIVELSGLKIESLYDYVYGLQSLKAQQPTSIKVLRSGQVEALTIVPTLKE